MWYSEKNRWFLKGPVLATSDPSSEYLYIDLENPNYSSWRNETEDEVTQVIRELTSNIGKPRRTKALALRIHRILAKNLQREPRIPNLPSRLTSPFPFEFALKISTLSEPRRSALLTVYQMTNRTLPVLLERILTHNPNSKSILKMIRSGWYPVFSEDPESAHYAPIGYV